MDRGSWRATVHGVSKSQTGLKQLSTHACKDSVEREWDSLVAWTVKNLPAMQETQVQSLGGEDPLEKVKATHSSIFAWRIQWTEEPCGLESMG